MPEKADKYMKKTEKLRPSQIDRKQIYHELDDGIILKLSLLDV